MRVRKGEHVSLLVVAVLPTPVQYPRVVEQDIARCRRPEHRHAVLRCIVPDGVGTLVVVAALSRYKGGEGGRLAF
jgi:hypothetical protein